MGIAYGKVGERVSTLKSSVIDEVRNLDVWELAEYAGCGTPDNSDSAGASFLKMLKHEFVEALTNDEDSIDDDRIHEIADDAPHVYTHNRWLEFVDLCAYQEDVSEYVDAAQTNLTDIAGVALYLIARRLLEALAYGYVEDYS